MIRHEHLIGRPFLWGVRDCFAHAREIFRDNFEITVTDYARPTDWSSDKEDLIRRHYEAEGFDLIADWKPKDLRPADILCMAVGERAANHLAVFVGDNMISHHLWGRLSSAELFRDFYRNTTCFVLRHHAVPDLRAAHPPTDLGSLLRDRYRVR